jgi:choline dehydrogenase-like flavoprotein
MIFLCRLSEVEDWNVLLLEAGGQEPDLSDIPAFASVLKGSNIDRQYVSQNENVSCGEKPCPMPRGIVLGGTSTINAMLYVRGSPEDYDHWAKLGNLLLTGKVLSLFVCFWCDSPQWARASSVKRFLDHTQRHTTVGRNPLEE